MNKQTKKGYKRAMKLKKRNNKVANERAKAIKIRRIIKKMNEPK